MSAPAPRSTCLRNGNAARPRSGWTRPLISWSSRRGGAGPASALVVARARPARRGRVLRRRRQRLRGHLRPGPRPRGGRGPARRAPRRAHRAHPWRGPINIAKAVGVTPDDPPVGGARAAQPHPPRDVGVAELAFTAASPSAWFAEEEEHHPRGSGAGGRRRRSAGRRCATRRGAAGGRQRGPAGLSHHEPLPRDHGDAMSGSGEARQGSGATARRSHARARGRAAAGGPAGRRAAVRRARLRVPARRRRGARRPRGGHRAARRPRAARRLRAGRGPLPGAVRAPGGRAARPPRAGRRAPGNLQAWARDTRYGEGTRMAATLGARLAAGHTATDQAETVLYRLAASPGRRALLGMADVAGLLVRPLLRAGLTREETAAWCRSRGLAWREDPSNEGDAYARGRVRADSCRRCARSTRRPRSNVVRTARCCARRPRCSTGRRHRPGRPRPDRRGAARGAPARARAPRRAPAGRGRDGRACPRGPRRACRRSSRWTPRAPHGALDLGDGALAWCPCRRCPRARPRGGP